MIKNVLKRFFGVGIFVLFGCLFNSCFSIDVWLDVSLPWYYWEIWANYINNTIYNDLTFENNQIVYYTTNNTDRYFTFGWVNWRPYWVATFRADLIYYQGYIEDVCVSTIANYTTECRVNWDGMANVNDVWENVPKNLTFDTFSYLTPSWGFYYAFDFCFINSVTNYVLCFPVTVSYAGWNINNKYFTETWNLVTTISTSNSLRYNFFDSVSPFVWGGWNGWNGWTLIPTSTDVDVAINYYETTKWFNENMCYVWTNNLTADFWTAGISFEDWTWSTIFELYNSQFSWFGNNIITNVWKFINVRTLNYWQWFYEWDNIKRLATDNWPDNWVSYIYTWFTFPFANKPVAIFFMASNLLDWYFTQQFMWNDVAFYCYIKLNYSQIKEWNISYTWDVLPLVPPAIQNNVEDHFKYQLNYWNTGYYYSPDWVWSWTWDYELSDNLELDWVFTNFLDNFNSKCKSKINIS